LVGGDWGSDGGASGVGDWGAGGWGNKLPDRYLRRMNAKFGS